MTLNNTLFMPSSPVHIVLYLLLIVMIDCVWCIVKRCYHIRLNICNLGCGVLHAVNNIIQMRTIQFQVFCFYQFIRIFIPTNSYCPVLNTNHFTDDFKKFIIQFSVLLITILHIMIVFYITRFFSLIPFLHIPTLNHRCY